MSSSSPARGDAPAGGAPTAASSSRLDRAAHLRSRWAEREALLAGCAVLPSWRGRFLIAGGPSGAPVLLEGEPARRLLARSIETVLLGLRDGRAIVAAALPPDEGTPRWPDLAGAGELSDLRLAGGRLAADDFALLAYARGMMSWHRRAQHCGRCGGATQSVQGGHVRRCEGCGGQQFPRTDPAIMALVTSGERCLLARQPSFPPGMWSLLAGFVEPGETLEEACIREVREEVGLPVRAPRYLRSQPWPFPASLMVGFVAAAQSETIELDGEELEAARWVARDKLAAPEGFFVPPAFSLAGQLIGMFARGEID